MENNENRHEKLADIIEQLKEVMVDEYLDLNRDDCAPTDEEKCQRCPYYCDVCGACTYEE